MGEPATAYAAVEEYAPLVKKIAGHLARRLPACVEFDDLIQAGMEGLMDAQEHYDGDQGAAFTTYAGIRIRGAMLDHIREGDWAPRSVYRAGRAITKAIAEIEAEVGRDARAEEVAERLDLGLEEYHRLLNDVDSARIQPLDSDPALTARAASLDVAPDGAAEAAQREEVLNRAVRSLPERERLAIVLYYDDELSLREIGEVLGVSESRACQLRTQAEARLRARLEGMMV